jgi:hypothetical protein
MCPASILYPTSDVPLHCSWEWLYFVWLPSGHSPATSNVYAVSNYGETVLSADQAVPCNSFNHLMEGYGYFFDIQLRISFIECPKRKKSLHIVLTTNYISARPA